MARSLYLILLRQSDQCRPVDLVQIVRTLGPFAKYLLRQGSLHLPIVVAFIQSLQIHSEQVVLDQKLNLSACERFVFWVSCFYYFEIIGPLLSYLLLWRRLRHRQPCSRSSLSYSIDVAMSFSAINFCSRCSISHFVS